MPEGISPQELSEMGDDRKKMPGGVPGVLLAWAPVIIVIGTTLSGWIRHDTSVDFAVNQMHDVQGQLKDLNTQLVDMNVRLSKVEARFEAMQRDLDREREYRDGTSRH